tara:strand:+ start:229 stop:2340 length:2112 start_codon:yes stop_codon:yes gene_type:complete
MLNYFAAAPKGFEYPLAQELKTLGAEQIKESVAGVYFSADLDVAYRVVMWSRLASRIVLILYQGKVDSLEAFYDEAFALDWPSHFDARTTFAVDFSGTNKWINNTQFGALKIKDAIVDRFREEGTQRPSVDKQDAEIRINARIKREQLTIGLNFSGNSMHQRGYRAQTGQAPLKENLACALLMRSQWHKEQQAVMDPFCGSGTILIEAALWAADVAPGLHKTQYGFDFWRGHQLQVWQSVVDEAQARAEAGLQSCTKRFYGSDESYKLIHIAKDNAQRAGVGHLVEFTCQDALEMTPRAQKGLLLSNPPFGQRIGEYNNLLQFFYQFGHHLKQHFANWQVSLLSSEPELLSAMKLKYDKQVKLYNGSLECVLCHYHIHEQSTSEPVALAQVAEPFVNRIKKNKKQIQKWAKQQGIDCYRLYDADLPEYNVAVDCYQDYVVVQEYAAPDTIPIATTEKRLTEVLLSLPQVLDCDPENMIVKQRRKQKGKAQYEKQQDEDLILIVEEYGARLKVNLTQYLDTGLFLDHRLTRKLVGEKSKGKDVLNLFSYTGTASVHAALGGAKSVTTVDMSKTYMRWARENFEINQLFNWNYKFIQEDCLQWLETDTATYDLIFVDPPTFSNSKRMEQTFDVQRDHVHLLLQLKERLRPEGEIIFSNNKRKFKMDHDALKDAGLQAVNIDQKTLPLDYKRRPHIHNCWIVTHAR